MSAAQNGTAGTRLERLPGGLTLVGADGRELRVELTPSRGRPTVLRAVLGGSGPGATVIDATAGLGGDAFDLATAGSRVIAFEKSETVWRLLRDALDRAGSDPGLADAAGRIELHLGDALDLLPRFGPVDAVYLDPLFERRPREAGKRKGMQLLHELIGSGEQGGEGEARLLEAAMQAARRRVTVKRRLRAPWLAGVRPSGSISGRTVRFDLYPGKAGKSG